MVMKRAVSRAPSASTNSLSASSAQHRRRERHELGALEQLVEPVVDRRVAGLIEDGPVPERARTVFHSPAESGDHVAFGELVRDLDFQVVAVMNQLETCSRRSPRPSLARCTRCRDTRSAALVARSGVPRAGRCSPATARPAPTANPSSDIPGWTKVLSRLAMRWISSLMRTFAKRPPASATFECPRLLEPIAGCSRGRRPRPPPGYSPPGPPSPTHCRQPSAHLFQAPRRTSTRPRLTSRPSSHAIIESRRSRYAGTAASGQPGDLSLVPLGLEPAERRDVGVVVPERIVAVRGVHALEPAAPHAVDVRAVPVTAAVHAHDQRIVEVAREVRGRGVRVVMMDELHRGMNTELLRQDFADAVAAPAIHGRAQRRSTPS